VRKPRRRANAYLLLEGWEARVTGGADVLFRGIWLGLLDAAELRAVTERRYDGWERYHTPEHNLSGLRRWEQDAVDRHFVGCCRLLVASAGAGREVLALARRGLAVDGFDCNARLVGLGERLLAEAGLTARMQWAPPDRLPEGLGTYDGIVIGWGGYMHVIGRRARVELLRALRAHTTARAPLLLSFFERSEPSQRFELLYRVARATRWLRRSPEPVERGDVLDGTFDHHFTRQEIAAELRDGGFELVEYGSADHGAPHAVARAR
jgi:hypothetical protein